MLLQQLGPDHNHLRPDHSRRRLPTASSPLLSTCVLIPKCPQKKWRMHKNSRLSNFDSPGLKLDCKFIALPTQNRVVYTAAELITKPSIIYAIIVLPRKRWPWDRWDPVGWRVTSHSASIASTKADITRQNALAANA
jgi:hypothetical protein